MLGLKEVRDVLRRKGVTVDVRITANSYITVAQPRGGLCNRIVVLARRGDYEICRSRLPQSGR